MNLNNTNRKPDVKSSNLEEQAFDLKARHLLDRKRNWSLVLSAAVIVTILLLSSCRQEDSSAAQPTTTEAEETFTEDSINELITPDDAKELLESDSEVLLLDVRTEAEYIELRIPDSLLLPVGELEDRLEEIAEWKEKTVIVYCRSGNRSSQAADILQNNGFMTIYDLGGIYDWPFDTESGPA